VSFESIGQTLYPALGTALSARPSTTKIAVTGCKAAKAAKKSAKKGKHVKRKNKK
jgi:hypothetical protein